MTRRHRVDIRINGVEHSAEVEARMLLVHFIRDVAALSGTKVGCDTSMCGACTVTLDGRLTKSCTILAVQAHGGEIRTIEGVADGDSLHPMQDAFAAEHGLQCGYCTPGMVLSGISLLEGNNSPSDTEIRRALGGNLCRCTGYEGIVASVRRAARDIPAG